MQLTLYTDYAFRTLIYLGIHKDKLSSINEISKNYNISHNHLMKIVYQLGKAGFIITTRGRRGGLRLGENPENITLGQVIRHTEEVSDPIKCDHCIIQNHCLLKGIICQTFEQFYQALDRYTLADILNDQTNLQAALKPLTHQPNKVLDGIID